MEDTQVPRLLALLEYIRQLWLERPGGAREAPRESLYLTAEALEGLEGVRLRPPGSEGEAPVWLTLARPPGPSLPPTPESPWLWPWLELGDAVTAAPRLARSVAGSALLAAGTHRDPAAPPDPEGTDRPVVAPEALVELSGYAHRGEVERRLAAYLRGQWQPWATAERTRRRHSRLFMQLLAVQQAMEGSASDGSLELLWGLLPVAGTAPDAAPLPLVVHPVRVRTAPDAAGLQVVPADAPPRLLTQACPGLEGPAAVAADQALRAGFAAAAQGFDPVDADGPEGALAVARAALDGQLPPLAPAGGWVLFSRARSTHPLAQDLERYEQLLRAGSPGLRLPAPVTALLVAPADTRSPGLAAPEDESGWCLPLPHNDEQLRVIRALEQRDAVVVQGPPGTGKTHTIANVVCHWLAQGRRVLVTATRETALSALRERMPEALRPLALALLSSDTEGLDAFGAALEAIAREVQRLDPEAGAAALARLEETVADLHARRRRTDAEMARLAAIELAPLVLDGETLDPLEAARIVALEGAACAWLPDLLDCDRARAPDFGDDDLDRLFAARDRLGADVEHAGAPLPAAQDLPSAEAMLDVHRRLVRLAGAPESRSADTPVLAVTDEGTEDRLREAAALAARVRHLRSTSAGTDGVADPPAGDATLAAFLAELARLESGWVQLQAATVVWSPGSDRDEEWLQSVRNLAAGRRGLGLGALFRPEARQRLAAVRVDGREPGGSGDWARVLAVVDLHRAWITLRASWVDQLGTRSLPVPAPDLGEGLPQARAALEAGARSQALQDTLLRLGAVAQALFPGWSLARRLQEVPAALRGLERAVEHYLNAQQLAGVWQVRHRLRELAGRHPGRLHDALRAFAADTLGNPALDDAALLRRWSDLCADFERLRGESAALATVAEVTARIARCGAPLLAARLREAVSLPREALVPATWRQGWRLRRLEGQLRLQSTGGRILKLSAERAELAQDLQRLAGEVVVRRAWLRLAERLSPSVRGALQAYLAAVQRIGRGTGKRAARHRRDAREAAEAAQAAVPCWILPHHRVSESLPSQLGSFDLVVVDEASQSDLSALPVLLRGARLLVVGDEKQVSPDPVGVEEDRVVALMDTHLSTQVPLHRMQMAPERSLYDLARVAWAGDTVMLKEHFRCAPPIIAFSRREFYGPELLPLRLPLPSQRLDPPLVDLHLPHGRREGDTNPAEAEAIVDQVAAIAADPALRGRSVGVVSLLGEEQARLVRQRIGERLGPGVLLDHAILCGDARALQGRERDIVFLSMVVARNDPGAPLARETFAQRFNVATSRARERMVLVRSVELEDLPASDRLRRHLLTHFRDPPDGMGGGGGREVCETPSERVLFDWLAARGYRVRAQVPVGAWRVDLVVEGAGDRRLALACDGDRGSGVATWLEDVARQRVMERVGWNVWRCFAPRLTLEPEAVLADLAGALARLGIEPADLRR